MAIPNWITLSQNSGNSGETIVTITASTYSELIDRTGTISVKCVNSSKSVGVEITQLAKDAITVTTSPSSLKVFKSGGVFNVQVISNGEWSISSIPEWISVSQISGNGNTTITCTFSDNTTGNDLRGNVVFTTIDVTYNMFVLQNSFDDYKDSYLTFVITDADSVGYYPIYWNRFLTNREYLPIYYSINGGNWGQTSSGSTGFGVRKGDVVRLKGYNSDYGYAEHSFNVSSHISYEVYGNIMSLVYGDDFINNENVGNISCKGLFENCSGMTSVENLVLPSTPLGAYCYSEMFHNCYQITKAPALPSMNLGFGCYENMFWNCSGLTTAPDLLAPDLVTSCYYRMFKGCSSLNYIKCLGTNISATQCTNGWVDGVSSTGTFVKSSGVDWSIKTGTSGIPIGWTVQEASGETDYSKEFLTIKITSNGTFSWVGNKLIQYRKNDDSWTDLTSVGEMVSSGDTILLKGNNSDYVGCSLSGSTCGFEVQGNIMSLIYDTNYIGQTTLLSANTFNGLFNGCSGLTSAENLILPATTLAQSCYDSMFQGCTSLTTAPELPATTLANQCYQYMFYGCTSLTTAPELPATNLASGCYEYMFQGCTSLTTAPELPATSLSTSTKCYMYMFQGCSSLTTAPVLPATSLSFSCYYSMFQGCSSLTTAPDLLAPDLVTSCYYRMFSGCTSLNYIKCLATDISASNCTKNWVSGVAPTGTFIKNQFMSDWSIDDISGVPSNWTVQDAT